MLSTLTQLRKAMRQSSICKCIGMRSVNSQKIQVKLLEQRAPSSSGKLKVRMHVCTTKTNKNSIRSNKKRKKERLQREPYKVRWMLSSKKLTLHASHLRSKNLARICIRIFTLNCARNASSTCSRLIESVLSVTRWLALAVIASFVRINWTVRRR